MVDKISRESSGTSYPGEMPVMPFGPHHPEVPDTTFVAPSATLIGDVVLSSDCAVMFGAVLRADRDAIRVGEGSNLQDNVVVHGDPGFPATIGRGVSVGHAAVIHGATIADHCLIGMGAILLNGCSIGEGSLIAAGAVIRPGTVIPPGSLVSGVPGQVKREVTEDELAHIRQNAATYTELARAYREG